MTLDLIRNVLGWCAILNMGILFWWFIFIAFAHDLTYRMHRQFIHISEEEFDRIHYAGMTFFKLAVFFFNIVPYLALRIVV